MSNLLEQAINCDDPDQAAKIIREAHQPKLSIVRKDKAR